MGKERKTNFAELAAAIEADKTAVVKNLVERFFEYDFVVNELDDALEDVLRAGWEDAEGNWHEPGWKLTVAKALANARHHLQELYELYSDIHNQRR